ncbi:D-alanyl-D-alanine carboxypeptidase family protein [Gryllotalpicola ginsengisoli]|uniref:D-alanyl-D-alanine carboxypeptidase family protein n=1 Tax=Gryllotalpicola ginsengisoli TaxID=444608 RepID=UPI0003B64EEF|nr:serine hydrolase [Gryllotalpicola ginsengisoli]
MLSLLSDPSRPDGNRRRSARLPRGPLALALVLALAVAAAVTVPRLLTHDAPTTYASTNGWPAEGQGAYVIGNGEPAASPDQKPVPIASVAKVMTAYLVLQKHPLQDGDDGVTFTVEQGDVADTAARRSAGQSVVAVAAGERLSERDALMAILLPSANNVAVLVARELDGSVDAFVEEMNETAQELGMTQTTYTDPSGYDPGTVSTALDQLRLAQVVAKDATLSAMMATRSYTIPVAGEITNTDSLLGHDGFVGMKTGSDEAAGGCFMFRAERDTANGTVTLIGVVLGQRGSSLIGAGLQAAQQLADDVAPIAEASDAPATGRPGRLRP